MYNYSKNNHFKWGWGEGLFNKPSGDHNERNKFTFGVCDRPHKGFREESLLAMREMCSSTNKPIMLALSGGIDSQVCFLSLCLNKIKFTPIILRYSVNDVIVNEHDISAAFEICVKYSIDPIVETIDIANFWFNSVDFINKHQISDISRLSILLTAKKYSEYYFIMGGGDPFLFPTDNYTWNWVHNPTPNLQYFINENQEGNTMFFLWSPELILSRFDHEPTKVFNRALKTMVNSFEHYTNNYQPTRWRMFSEFYCDWCKPLVYVDAFPELIQRKKYMGFETLSKHAGPDFIERLSKLFTVHKSLSHKRDIVVPLSEILSYISGESGSTEKYFYSNDDPIIELEIASKL